MSDPTTTATRVRIDRAICIGSGTCVRLAPGAIQMGDDGIAYVSQADEQDITRLRQAARSCPTGAISITRE